MVRTSLIRLISASLIALLAIGCAQKEAPLPQLPSSTGDSKHSTRYKIAPGDTVQIFVWRNPDLSTSVPVRPDGYLTAPLLEDVLASGRTPTELSRDLEKTLATYVRDPLVTVIVNGFVGNYDEQIRIVGEATSPQSMLYRDDMSLLDVMIAVGGVTDFADGDSAIIVRIEDGQQVQYGVRIDSLIRDGDISANVDMQPGDILIIPESWY